MIKKSKQAAGFIAVCLLLLQTGCMQAGDRRPLLWWGSETFPFEMTLPSPVSEGEPIILTGERTPDSVSVAVVFPERLQGLTVRYGNGNTVLCAGDTEIPLSKDAAEGLTCILDGLLVTSAEGAKIGSTEEGAAILTFDSFALILDENGLPKAILDTESGRRAAFSAELEKNSDNTNKDQQNNEHQTENRGGDF